MNWKLIFTLSLLGIIMAVSSLFGLPHNSEPFLWLLIFVIYAVWIVKKADGKYFQYALAVSVINGVWIALIHATFFSTYAANNPEAMEGYKQLPQFVGPQAMMLIMGPIIGAVTGLIAGLF